MQQFRNEFGDNGVSEGKCGGGKEEYIREIERRDKSDTEWGAEVRGKSKFRAKRSGILPVRVERLSIRQSYWMIL